MNNDVSKSSAVHHETIELSRYYDASCNNVFTAYADRSARCRWAAPPGVTLAYEQDDFTVGGRDLFTCLSAGNTPTTGDVRYEEIIKDQRIIFVETLSENGTRLSSSLTTIELYSVNSGTQLVITLQIACLVSKESSAKSLIHGYQQGWQIVLENLTGHLNK